MKKLYLSLCLIQLLITVIYLHDPYIFLRSIQIKSIASIKKFDVKTISMSYPEVIKNIKNNNKLSTFSVRRNEREKAFLDGVGDCSNQSTGLGVYLQKHNLDYAIIHFLPLNNFYSGIGHTVLLVKYKKKSIIVDVISKGYPLINGKPTNLNKLDNYFYLVNKKIGIYKINNFGSNVNSYYSPNYISILGVTPSNEYDKFYNFTEFINKFYEFNQTYYSKIIINSLAAMFFCIPKIYISNDAMDKLKIKLPLLNFYKFIAFSYVFCYWVLIILTTMIIIKKFIRISQ